MEEKIVLCGANAYDKKYYFNQKFDKIRSYVLEKDDNFLDDDLSDDFINFTSAYIDVPIKYDKLNINDLNYESIKPDNASERG